jgi:hypothetical protein
MKAKQMVRTPNILLMLNVNTNIVLFQHTAHILKKI